MMHPHTRLAWVDDVVGAGVVATRDIPRGTITWVLDPLDQRIRRESLPQLDPLYRATIERYTYEESDGDLVLCWDHGRFLNHSCDATCLSGGFPFEIAVRDIAEGDQITDDYETFGVAFRMQCACGSPLCRGLVGDLRPDLEPWWAARYALGLSELRDVPQPLAPLVAPELLRQAVDTYLGGVSRRRSTGR